MADGPMKRRAAMHRSIIIFVVLLLSSGLAVAQGLEGCVSISSTQLYQLQTQRQELVEAANRFGQLGKVEEYNYVLDQIRILDPEIIRTHEIFLASVAASNLKMGNDQCFQNWLYTRVDRNLRLYVQNQNKTKYYSVKTELTGHWVFENYTADQAIEHFKPIGY